MIVIILIGIVVILICLLLHKNRKYKELYTESIQNKIIISTQSEFILQVSTQIDEKIVNNDMVNAVKTCVNKGIYELKMADTFNDRDTYERFAQNMLELAKLNNKE